MCLSCWVRGEEVVGLLSFNVLLNWFLLYLGKYKANEKVRK